MSQPNDEAPDDDFESKSERKRKATALKDVAERLTSLSDAQLDHLELPERLTLTVRQARSISAFGGRRRQVMYISKLLRDDTLDLNAINAFLDRLDGKKVPDEYTESPVVTEAEQWRDRIVDDEATIFVLRETHPSIDTQRLRQWGRNARKAPQSKQAKNARKALLGYLEEIFA